MNDAEKAIAASLTQRRVCRSCNCEVFPFYMPARKATGWRCTSFKCEYGGVRVPADMIRLVNE